MEHNHEHYISHVNQGAQHHLKGNTKLAAAFYDAMADLVDNDYHYRILALLLDGEHRLAMDELREWLQVADDNAHQSLSKLRAAQAEASRGV